MNKKQLQVLRNKREREYDVAHGLLVRKYAINLVADMLMMSSEEQITNYENSINIIQALQCGPMSRAGNGITLELALKEFLINLCPKKLPNREKSVIRVDEIINQGDSAVYDLLIDFSIWNQDANMRNLAISMLMATNRFVKYEDAERVFNESLIGWAPNAYFPIQIKKNNENNSDLMTDKSINTNEIRNFYKDNGLILNTPVIIDKHFNNSRIKLHIPYRFTGLFFNNFFIENENVSILEVMPMPWGGDFYDDFDDGVFRKNYNFSYLEKEDILKLIPTRNCKTDVGFIINKNKCRYHINNRREKNQQYVLKIKQRLEKNSITEELFVKSAMGVLSQQLCN